jgi:dTDP-4-amino-4,6-dideoxygalactose transaminase
LGFSGEVILPSLTFVATAHALQWQQIKPVFCDVDPVTLCIDPNQVKRHITSTTTGILGVHVYGHGCDTEALQAIADAHGLKLMFDAAHAFGNVINGKKIGSFGECEVFSFHATKFFNTFEGGAVATNNDELAEKIRFMQNFGFADMDRVDHIGTNGKMTEICAAMGLVNLRSMEGFLETNLRNHDIYAQGLAGIPGLRMIQNPNGQPDTSNHQYVLVEVEEGFALSRDELMKRLHAENVLVRRYFWPGCHRMEPYKTLQPDAGAALPVTEALLGRILLFPTGTSIDPASIQRIIAFLQNQAG